MPVDHSFPPDLGGLAPACATERPDPRVEALPGWRLPPAFVEGSHAERVRTLQKARRGKSVLMSAQSRSACVMQHRDAEL